jgi:type IV secretion system protein TrbF
MRFTRPQVRYSDTPEPVTPYQAAAQVWDNRIGNARVQARNWRLMALGCLVLALLMAAGLVWRAGQSLVTVPSQRCPDRLPPGAFCDGCALLVD